MSEDKARITYLKGYADELVNGSILVTIHIIVRDNRKDFYFVENNSPSVGSLNYKLLNFDTILLDDFPNNFENGNLNLIFYFDTSLEPTSGYNDFNLYIQFFTRNIISGVKAFSFQGLRKTSIEPNEHETEVGVIFFPDIRNPK